MKRGLYLAPFDELADPRLLAELGRAAESVGWDGVFLGTGSPTRLGNAPWPTHGWRSAPSPRRPTPFGSGRSMVTPLARRRVQKLARGTVTLDHLSNGRLTLGVGLGNGDDLDAGL